MSFSEGRHERDSNLAAAKTSVFEPFTELHTFREASSNEGHLPLSKSLSTPAEHSFRIGNRYSSTANGPPPARRQLSRAQSIRESISNGTARFFGVPQALDRQPSALGSNTDSRWTSRRLRYMNKRYGGYNAEEAAKKQLDLRVLDDLSDLATSLATPITCDQQQIVSGQAGVLPLRATEPLARAEVSRSSSVESRASRLPKVERRDSVAKMAWNGISSIVQRGTLRSSKRPAALQLGRNRGRSSSSSFSPFSIQPCTVPPSHMQAYELRPPSSAPIQRTQGIFEAPWSAFVSRARASPLNVPYDGCGPGSADSRKSGRSVEATGMSTVIEVDDELKDASRDRSRLSETKDEEAVVMLERKSKARASVVEGSSTMLHLSEGSNLNRFVPFEDTNDTATEVGNSQSGEYGRRDAYLNSCFPYEAQQLPRGSREAIQDEVFFDIDRLSLPASSSAYSSFGNPRHFTATIPSPEQSTNVSAGVGWIPLSRRRKHQSAPVPRPHPRLAEYPPVIRTEEPLPPNLSISALREADGDRFADPNKYERRAVPAAFGKDSRLGTGSPFFKVPDVALQNLIVDRPTVPADSDFESRQMRRRQRGGRLRRQEGFDAGSQTPIGYSQDSLLTNRVLGKENILKTKVHDVGDVKALGDSEPKVVRNYSILERIHEKFRSQSKKQPVRRRHGIGFGIWSKLFYRKLKRVDRAVQEQLDSFDDYRPYFTYWITSVQIVVTLVSMITYGFGPFGFGSVERTADVLHSSVTLKHVAIYEQGNFWLGPKFSDLVHLGATFAPCMRRDPEVFAKIEEDRRLEKETGCCIYNDGTGCFQSGQKACPELIASLVKWKGSSLGPDGRTSGAVCGQDPKFCDDPPSVPPYEWPDDITSWPICTRPSPVIPENQKHLLCEVTGRPCCIELNGECRITTRDYCDFVQGHFHENATLCSQVSCLGEVCGMLPFLSKDQPDQFYRLFIPLFLHAGILHCLLTVAIQWYYMRDLEKLIGWARMFILYMGAGIGGNLASAIFVPYLPKVGPAGSHVGMFAAMFTDIIYNWRLIANPWKAVRELSIFTVALFLFGLLPWIDNWAHMFGFLFGFLLSLALFPYIQFAKNDRTKRILIVTISLTTAMGLFVVLLFMFYTVAGFECSFCEYFNCIPFTDRLCDRQGLKLKKWLDI